MADKVLVLVLAYDASPKQGLPTPTVRSSHVWIFNNTAAAAALCMCSGDPSGKGFAFHNFFYTAPSVKHLA
jgi:hypothetical protein